MSLFSPQMAMLDRATAPELRGTVTQVRGLAVRVTDLPVPVGSLVRVHTQRGQGPPVEGEVVGLDEHDVIVMPLAATGGISRGDQVVAVQQDQSVQVGPGLLGRVVDGMGRPMDGRGSIGDRVPRPLHPDPLDPLQREPIEEPLATGVRAVDAMLSIGRGQRIGAFAMPGVGKSTLLGTMAKHTAADISVIALVGERGREVREFIDNTLGEEGLKRSVVVCATGDEPALLRVRAAMVATSIAEYFRDEGNDVLLIMDSITRFCQAQRQIGLTAGEPPATRGYPPSVFAMLPTLLERSGRTQHGSITGLYSVLVEGGDMDEPISDACRGVLDGHVQLSRQLAEKGHYPAIDVLSSISRAADDVTDRQQQAARRDVIKCLSDYQQVEDLVNIGAYASGSNPDYDVAIACKQAIDQLLQQGRQETQSLADFQRTRAQLLALKSHIEQTRSQIGQNTQSGGQYAR
jgi:flagellum-specific ATP synthase